jgi:hypothetical protein
VTTDIEAADMAMDRGWIMNEKGLAVTLCSAICSGARYAGLVSALVGTLMALGPVEAREPEVFYKPPSKSWTQFQSELAECYQRFGAGTSGYTHCLLAYGNSTQPYRAATEPAHQPPAAATPQQQPSLQVFNGDYYNTVLKFGLQIRDGEGAIATSNNPSYRVGDIILRFKAISPVLFLGDEKAPDGQSYSVTGLMLKDGSIRMSGMQAFSPTGLSEWVMVPVAATNMAGMAPSTSARASPPTTANQPRDDGENGAAQAEGPGANIVSSADRSGIKLVVEFNWENAANNGHHGNGISAQIILFTDHIIVSKYGMAPESDNEENGCGKRLVRGPNGKVLPSVENMQQVLNCQDHAARLNESSTHHSVFLPSGAGQRRCTETRLSDGSYRVCAALLSASQDILRMEYEEDINHDGQLSALRARFDITLLRDPGERSGRILGCTAKIVAAYTFNPNQPTKLTAYDHTTVERCTRDAV